MAGLKNLKKRRRVQVILVAAVALAVSTALVGYAMRDGINFFRSPSQVAEAPPAGALLTVDLAHALSFVDWRSPDEDGDGLLTEADGVNANTVTFGLLATPTYALTLVE